MTERVALYLQDSHDLRDGLDYAKYAEEKVLKPSGKPNQDSSATPLCPWLLMPQ